MKISVIIPHFRGETYLRDALYSLKVQEYPSMEVLLILDGCSEDLSGLKQEYSDLNIREFSTKAKAGSPKGVAVARNIGLKEAEGEYIFFLDSDDYLSDGYFSALEETVSILTVCHSSATSQVSFGNVDATGKEKL